MASGYQRLPKKPFSFAAGKANTLRCGAPLEIKVTAKKRKPESWELNSGCLRNPPPASDSEFMLSINANVRGADGEVYSDLRQRREVQGRSAAADLHGCG